MYDEKLDMLVQEALHKVYSTSIKDDDTPTLRKATGYSQPVSEQSAEFRKILDDLYELHVKKTADYSSWNIKGAGEQGVVVRLWDKTARLMNLMGWDIGTGKWTTPKEPKNESVDDTLYDLASYAIIMLVLRRGKWGKE